ncbi:hypothetical protein LTR05_004147 [Lithohypha guttulata]|uniref:Uncharacterized protein n=1 Tax=Lithohypha guttulata TaxID=1690604 RepID=A0AAN7T197_9EURO|nr:hypothetical protein LTR05_004147 [Lithohypha guttulata]
MSSTISAPTAAASSFIANPPLNNTGSRVESQHESHAQKGSLADGDLDSGLQVKQGLCPQARLRIHLDDISHPALSKFTVAIDLSNLLEVAIHNVQKHLFTPPDDMVDDDTTANVHQRPPPQRPIPSQPVWKPQEVRSVTLILRPMDGVAYTDGTTLDEAHKEIHLSLDYLQAKINQFHRDNTPTASLTKSMPKETADPQSTTTTSRPTPTDVLAPTKEPQPNSDSSNASLRHEVKGVVTHEMVHAFQHNASSTCPGGLIEGIADYVRLKSNLNPPHWKPWPANKDTRGDKWDAGYQKTAWFLEWIEDNIGGKGCVGRLNEAMRKAKWADGDLWKYVMHGISVEECWDLYKGDWESLNKKHGEEKTEVERN